MKTYKKPRRRTGASRKRHLLDQMNAANHREWTAVTMASSEKEARARIQERYPDEAVEQIERRVAFVMKGGAKPTTTKVLTSGRIPPEVFAARKVERKRQVKANRHRRRVDELERKLAAEQRRALAGHTPSDGGRNA
jgi:hypothetical protein